MEEATSLCFHLQRKRDYHVRIVCECRTIPRETARSEPFDNYTRNGSRGLEGLQALSPRRCPPLGAFIKLPALRVVHDF
jgi:hypothetical protein